MMTFYKNIDIFSITLNKCVVQCRAGSFERGMPVKKVRRAPDSQRLDKENLSDRVTVPKQVTQNLSYSTQQVVRGYNVFDPSISPFCLTERKSGELMLYPQGQHRCLNLLQVFGAGLVTKLLINCPIFTKLARLVHLDLHTVVSLFYAST